MQMKTLQYWRNCYAGLLAISVLLTAWYAVKQVLDAAFIFGSISIALLTLLVKQNRLLYDASLIWDNRILAVPSAVISRSDSKENSIAEEAVVSTFGILIGSNIYKWGCDGVRGVRLKAIEIDPMRIYLSFGDNVKNMQVELLHGMTDKQEVIDVKQRLWRETGVTAIINGW
jgi:hypothetical protein